MDIKAAILSSTTKKIKKSTCQNGASVFMRTMTAGERDAWELAWLGQARERWRCELPQRVFGQVPVR
jgi:hypothetical protein